CAVSTSLIRRIKPSDSLKFDHNFDIEEQSEEEVRETMTETMEQYMSKTRENYGPGITRPAINQYTPFELKGKFLKELCDNTFSGSEHEDANEHIEKERDESLFRAWGRFKELMMKCPQHYLTDMQEVILFYNRLDVPTRQILDSKGVIPSKTAIDAKVAIQEMAEYSQKWHNGTSSRTRRHYRAAGPGFYQRNNGNSSYPDRRTNLEESLTKFMAESAKRHEENSNIIKEIRASTNAAIRNQRALIQTLEIQIGQMSKVLQERGFGSLPSSTETKVRDQVKSISTTKADFYGIRRIGCGPYAVSGI
ncbi:hypothetical protein Tco_1160409, partial [Tanacetum coccineum]